ncbi:MAG: hypothetical protein J4G17_12805, partial [Anaerolineae bacterium]|nr:hypothetical protein [Anaerolineae bacterium]
MTVPAWPFRIDDLAETAIGLFVVASGKGLKMRIETNHTLVRRNRRLAQYLFFVSIEVLVGSFIYVISQPLGGTLPDPGTLEGTEYLLLPDLVL